MEIKNPLKFFERLTLEELKGLKNIIFIVLVADIVGIYWYWELKKLGIAILMVLMGVLTVILIFERRKEENMSQEKYEEEDEVDEDDEEEEEDEDDDVEYEEVIVRRPKKKKKVKKVKKKLKKKVRARAEDREETQGGSGMEWGAGLPDPDEYNKRVERSLGGGFGF